MIPYTGDDGLRSYRVPLAESRGARWRRWAWWALLAGLFGLAL